MNNQQLSVMALLYLDGKLNVGKAALALSMVDDELDQAILDAFKKKGLNCIITRAGGRGDNLMNKILRNTVAAAVNGAIVPDTIGGRQLIMTCLEKGVSSLQGAFNPVGGAGIKIGIVSDKNELAVAFFGSLGISGLDADHFISGLGTINTLY